MPTRLTRVPIGAGDDQIDVLVVDELKQRICRADFIRSDFGGTDVSDIAAKFLAREVDSKETTRRTRVAGQEVWSDQGLRQAGHRDAPAIQCKFGTIQICPKDVGSGVGAKSVGKGWHMYLDAARTADYANGGTS